MMSLPYTYSHLAFMIVNKQSAVTSPDSLSAALGISGTILGVVLGGVAIWLSLYFFRRASESERRAVAVSQSITSSLEIIQQIHDKMYSDLFGMTKEAYDDIRAKAFDKTFSEPARQHAVVDVAAINVDNAKIEMQRNFDQILSRLDSTDNQVKALASITRPLIATAVDKGRAAAESARASATETDILNMLETESMSAESIMRRSATSHPTQGVIESIRRLYATGKITWSSPTLEADTVISRTGPVL